MNAAREIIYLCLLAVSLAAPSVSLAYKCAGTNINNLVSWEPSEIAKGTTLATMRVTSVIVGDDPECALSLGVRRMHRHFPHDARRQDTGEAEVARVRTRTATC